MRLPLSVLTRPTTPWEVTRCCDDLPRGAVLDRTPTLPRGWPRKLLSAVGPSVAVFRRQIAEPAGGTAEVGTPVVSSSGRDLGTVSGLVVELTSGRALYAVNSEPSLEGPVLLLPRGSVRPSKDGIVIDEHVLRRLVRKSA